MQNCRELTSTRPGVVNGLSSGLERASQRSAGAGLVARLCCFAAVVVASLSTAAADVCTPSGGIDASFQSSLDYRSFVTGIVGSVPGAGSALSGTVKLLWKDNSSSSLFDQMKDYVDRLVPELISQDHSNRLKQLSAGFSNALNLYLDAHGNTEKSQLLSSLVTTLTAMQEEFFDPRAPERTLDSFAQYGTVNLFVLRERYVHTMDYWPDSGQEDIKSHHKQLQDTAGRYLDAVVQIRQKALSWRLSKLPAPEKHECDTTFLTLGGTCKTEYSVRDDFCDWNAGGWRGTLDGANSLFIIRYNAVANTYKNDLKLILQPADGWATLAGLPSRQVSFDNKTCVFNNC
jgi:hypothetical protein